jgi:hypothetical protein
MKIRDLFKLKINNSNDAIIKRMDYEVTIEINDMIITGRPDTIMTLIKEMGKEDK